MRAPSIRPRSILLLCGGVSAGALVFAVLLSGDGPARAARGAASARPAAALSSPRRAKTPTIAPKPTTARTCRDEDGDGYGAGCAAGPDCNDRDAAIHPGARERCNFRDDNCSGVVDDSAACHAPALQSPRVRIAANVLAMGSAPGVGHADEHPRHRVRVSSFVIDRYEVTNRRYRACVAAGRCRPPALASSARRAEYYGNPRFADYPVVFVDHGQAAAFCRFAAGRLPTEAEWELAARGAAPSSRTYPWGDARPDCTRANMGGAKSCVGDTDRVGRRLAGRSPFGLFDVAGNVWEWVSDWYDARYYKHSPARDPRGPAHGRLKVMRGGCWLSGASSLRVSCRKAELPTSWAYNVGFRCAYPANAPTTGGVR